MVVAGHDNSPGKLPQVIDLWKRALAGGYHGWHRT